MPHIGLLSDIIMQDHRGQQLRSVHQSISVYLKLAKDFDSSENRNVDNGILLS